MKLNILFPDPECCWSVELNPECNCVTSDARQQAHVWSCLWHLVWDNASLVASETHCSRWILTVPMIFIPVQQLRPLGIRFIKPSAQVNYRFVFSQAWYSPRKKLDSQSRTTASDLTNVRAHFKPLCRAELSSSVPQQRWPLKLNSGWLLPSTYILLIC